MEAKDALVLEILARVSKGEGYQRLAASETLIGEVEARFRDAEDTLRSSVRISCAVNDDEHRGNWQLIYHDGTIHINHSGAVGFTNWERVPKPILVEALPLVSRLVSEAKNVQNATQSSLLQASAAFNAAKPEEELPTLRGTELPAPEEEPEEPEIADNNPDFVEPKAATDEILAALSEDSEPEASPESVLADEILAGIDAKTLDFNAPLPELKPTPVLPKASKTEKAATKTAKAPAKSVKKKK